MMVPLVLLSHRTHWPLDLPGPKGDCGATGAGGATGSTGPGEIPALLELPYLKARMGYRRPPVPQAKE